MNRKRIIVIGVLVIAVITTVVIWQIIASFHKLTISSPSNTEVSLYNKSNSKELFVLNLSQNTTAVNLNDGEYCIKSTDNMFSDNPICFEIKGKDKVLVFSPNYSDTHLVSMLGSQISDINNVINNKYKQIINDYVVGSGELMVLGDWYATTLTQKVDRASDQGDVYRLVLHKVNGKWVVVAGPQIILSSKEFKNIPYEVLDRANRMIGNY